MTAPRCIQEPFAGRGDFVDGVVYWGSGYARIGGIGNNKVYAFSLPEE